MDYSRIEAMLELVAVSARARTDRARRAAFVALIDQVIDVDYAVYCEHGAGTDLPLQVTV